MEKNSLIYQHDTPFDRSASDLTLQDSLIDTAVKNIVIRYRRRFLNLPYLERPIKELDICTCLYFGHNSKNVVSHHPEQILHSPGSKEG